VGMPVDPVREGVDCSGPLTGPPFLVKVDRYGSVSGLVRVRTPLGVLVVARNEPQRNEGPYAPSGKLFG